MAKKNAMASQADAAALAKLLSELRKEEAELLSEAQRMIEHNKTAHVPKGFEFKDFVLVESLRRQVQEIIR